MGGVEDSVDFWINWSPDAEYGGIDRRVGEWIRDLAERGENQIREAMYEGAREAEERETEKRERAELARLKAKFECPSA